MANTATAPALHAERRDDRLPAWRIWVLRGTYLLLIVGLGLMNLPELIGHEPTARGVIPSFLGALWLLAFIGLRYPVQMLPLLMFEFTWKAVWMLDYGLRQYFSGQQPETFAEDWKAIGIGVIVMIAVLPWTFIWRRYFRQPSEAWR